MPIKKNEDEATGVASQIEDLTAFPIMVSDGFTTMLGAPAGPPPSGPPGDLGATASSAIKNVLGWSWRPGADPKGLIGALNTSFKAIPKQGRVDYQYQQRTYAVAVQADMGTITGAQASLYTRANAILDQMLLLLSGLTPLLPDPDLTETEALRSLVRTEISDVVQQLGAEGGPNVQLVDKAFALLGGGPWSIKGNTTTFDTQTFEKVEGHLGDLREAFGLENQWVNTIPEEQNLTNYIVLVDDVNTLYASWRTNRDYFIGSGSKAFMGTQLIQVSRALAVVADAVDQLCYVMDTVFIRQAERQTLKINFGRGRPPMFFGDLLSWIRNFVTDEGPRIMIESGKDGVRTFTTTARRLRELVEGSKGAGGVPPGFNTRRVQDAFQNLLDQLDDAIAQAEHIKRFPPPKLDWFVLNVDAVSDAALLTVYGHNLTDSTTILFSYEDKDKPTYSDLEQGARVETYVSVPATAHGKFKPSEVKNKLRNQFNAIDAAERGAYRIRLVLRNNDEQADSIVLTGIDLQAVQP